MLEPLNQKNNSGFSLVEVLIAAAMLGGLLMGYMQLTRMQNKSADALQGTIARLDLEKSLMSSMSNGSICTFILNDSTQGSLASSPNRSIDTFDSASVTTGSPLIISINRLLASASAAAPIIAEVGVEASGLSSKLKISSMKFVIKPNLPPDLYLADFQVDFEVPLMGRKTNPIIIKNIQIATDTSSPLNAKKIIGCSGWGEPRAQRFSFTATSNWTVPVGTRRAFVTMAGGGGSGLGWRITSNLISGNSGGYAFSQPINVTPGEVMQVVVGKGGRGYPTINTGVPANLGPPYYIYTNPPGDDGLGGHPGESSKLISPLQGTLLECAGGSGATVGGIDSFTGSVVAGNMPGALTGSGVPTTPSPNRVAAGIYANAGGPGGCGPGPAGYGTGNRGASLWGISSGSYAGGTTPFGYGSGGDVYVTGCYISATTIGTCINPANGRDGVVFIDTW